MKKWMWVILPVVLLGVAGCAGNKQLQSDYDAALLENQNLKTQLQALQGENSSLKGQTDTVASELDQLRSQNAQLAQQINELRTSQSTLEKENLKMKSVMKGAGPAPSASSSESKVIK